MNIHILQHVPFEGPGSIDEWAHSKGHQITTTRFFAQEQFPPLDHFDLLVVLGGPMSVHDEHLYHWLRGEKWFIRQVIEADKPVLGICLGAQLIAEVLGGEVTTGAHKEIGWFPISLEEEAIGQILPEAAGTNEMTVFHWHGETFSLPPGSRHLAHSRLCEHQAFIYKDRVIALQFHLETNAHSVQNMVEYCGHELLEAGAGIQGQDEILETSCHYKANHALMAQLLEHLLSISN